MVLRGPMPKLIIEQDDGSREEYTNFFVVAAIDTEIERDDDEIGSGAIIHTIIGYDCRLMVVGGMLEKAAMKAGLAWDEFIKRHFSSPPLVKPDDEALNMRIKWSSN